MHPKNKVSCDIVRGPHHTGSAYSSKSKVLDLKNNNDHNNLAINGQLVSASKSSGLRQIEDADLTAQRKQSIGSCSKEQLNKNQKNQMSETPYLNKNSCNKHNTS